MSEKTEAALKSQTEKMGKTPGVKKAAYLGKGRYEISIDQDLKPGQSAEILNLFNYKKQKDGVYEVTGFTLKPSERSQIQALNIQVNGKAEVILPSNAKVIENNAQSTPGLLSKSYGWTIGSISEKPSIRFTLSP